MAGTACCAAFTAGCAPAHVHGTPPPDTLPSLCAAGNIEYALEEVRLSEEGEVWEPEEEDVTLQVSEGGGREGRIGDGWEGATPEVDALYLLLALP